MTAMWRRIPITIRAAIVTVVGGGIFVLIGSILTPLVDHWLEPTPIVLTQIADPTPTLAFTPISPTNVSISATSAAVVPVTPTLSSDYIVSRGLSANCFDAQYWTPQHAIALSTDDNNCWILDGWRVLPKPGGFKVFINPANNVISHWISTPISENARISFTVNISDFHTIDGVFGSIVFGFGDSSNDVFTDKFLIYRVINAASRNIYMYFGDPVRPDDNPLPQIGVYPKSTDQEVVLVVKKISVEVYLDEEKVFGPISLSRNERESFWIGFSLPESGSLNASISDFEINEIAP